MMDRRGFLSTMCRDGLAAAAIVACRRQPPDEATRRFAAFIAAQDRGLGDIAFERGLWFGAATKGRLLISDPAYTAALARECRIVSSEFDFKWDKIFANPERPDFGTSDFLVHWAAERGKPVRGHCMVWHHGLPPWVEAVTEPPVARGLMERYARDVIGRYRGRVASWDVVNEAVNPGDRRSDGLANTMWLRLLGPDYLRWTFQLAAAADPHAQLVYNETGLETERGERKRTAVLRLLERLVRDGAPIHALGVQGHLQPTVETIDERRYRDFLGDVAALGLRVLVTELDVADQPLPADVSTRDRIVADAYARFLDVTLDERAVIAVQTWNITDRESWLAKFRPRSDGLPVRPLPLDDKLARTPAWHAIATSLANAPQRTLHSW